MGVTGSVILMKAGRKQTSQTICKHKTCKDIKSVAKNFYFNAKTCPTKIICLLIPAVSRDVTFVDSIAMWYTCILYPSLDFLICFMPATRGAQKSIHFLFQVLLFTFGELFSGGEHGNHSMHL